MENAIAVQIYEVNCLWPNLLVFCHISFVNFKFCSVEAREKLNTVIRNLGKLIELTPFF